MTGKIGLAGVHQLTGAFKSALVSGDYDLNYDKDRVGNSVDGSGWYLTNNISFTLVAYALTNVKTTLIDDNNFSLSGDVVLTSANAQMMMATEGTDVGNFTFTTLAQTSSIANYSDKSEKLVLPVVKVANTNYSATLKLISMSDGSFAFDLLSAKKTTETPSAQSASFSSTGVVTMPVVESTRSDGQKNKVKAEMKLIEGSSPLRFVLTKIENVAK